MSKLPWFLSIIFAILAGSGWWKALSNTKKEQISKKNRQEIIRDIISQKDFSSDKFSEEQDNIQEETIQVCMDNPQIKKKLERKAKQWAEEISNQVLEDYKEEEQRKEEQQASERMNAMEDFFSNAVNIYSDTYDIEPEISDQLHQIVESGFEKQRNLHQQKIQGEITEREFGKLRRQYRRDGKEAVFELLGEEGSRDFGDILREEGQKAREDRDRREEDGENTE